MTPPTPQDQRRRQALLDQITKLGFCLPGTLTERHTRCSSPGCRCGSDPPALHGPYYSWTRKIAGKTFTRTLSPEQAVSQAGVPERNDLHHVPGSPEFAQTDPVGARNDVHRYSCAGAENGRVHVAGAG